LRQLGNDMKRPQKNPRLVARAEEKMREAPSCRSIADAMASKAASYIHIAPPEHRDAVMASIAEGFRDACQEHGIPIEAGDMAYYVEVVTAKAAEMRKMRPD
jgi:hypothetical protein